MKKQCTRCGETKDVSEFYKKRVLKSGKIQYNSQCKTCRNEYQRAYCDKNIETLRDYRRKYYGFKMRPKQPTWASKMYKGIKQRERLQGKIYVEEGLDAWFLMELFEKQKGKCYYSGVEMNQEGLRLSNASLDRVDSAIGYTKDNVVLVCMGINFMKNKDAESDLRELLKQIRAVE